MRPTTWRAAGTGGAIMGSLVGSVRERSPWQNAAACAGHDPQRWETDDVTDWHRAVCARCPVLVDCAVDAVRRPVTGMIRAGIACDRTTKYRRMATRDQLVDVLNAHGIEVTVQNHAPPVVGGPRG